MGKGENSALCVTSQDKALPLASMKEHAAEVEVPPDALGRKKSFCTGSQVGQHLHLSRTDQREVTQFTDSLIYLCLLSALQPQLARTQHMEGRPEKEETLVFLSKMKLQRAVRDKQSTRAARMPL